MSIKDKIDNALNEVKGAPKPTLKLDNKQLKPIEDFIDTAMAKAFEFLDSKVMFNINYDNSGNGQNLAIAKQDISKIFDKHLFDVQGKIIKDLKKIKY